MMPSYSSIVVIVLKWWKKLTAGQNPVPYKPNLLLILVYVVMIFACIYLYQQWTDIPLRIINLDMYELDSNKSERDTVYADIDVNLDLYRTHSRIAKVNKKRIDNTLVNIYFQEKNKMSVYEKGTNYYLKNAANSSDTSKSTARAMRLYYELLCYNDTIKNKADSIDICGVKHMVVFDIKIDGVVPKLWCLSGNSRGNNVLKGFGDLFAYVDSSYINLKGHFFKPDVELKSGLVYGFNNGTGFTNLQYSNSLFSSPFSILRLEDISQQYLCIKINNRNPDNRWGDSNLEVRNLAINTIGASDVKCKTEVKPLGIDTIVCSPRMDGIDIKGNVEEVLLYIESKEGSSLQSFRLFFLTTVMTVLITLLLSSVFSLYRSLKARRKESIPTLIEK